jgi:hypothetical protein
VFLPARGKLGEAEPLFREALDGRRKVLGGVHPQTADSLSALGRHADAEPLLVSGYEALKAGRKVPPADLDRALDRLVKLYEALGKPETWRKILDQAKSPPKEPTK